MTTMPWYGWDEKLIPTSEVSARLKEYVASAEAGGSGFGISAAITFLHHELQARQQLDANEDPCLVGDLSLKANQAMESLEACPPYVPSGPHSSRWAILVHKIEWPYDHKYHLSWIGARKDLLLRLHAWEMRAFYVRILKIDGQWHGPTGLGTPIKVEGQDG